MKNNISYLLLIFSASIFVACDGNDMLTADAGKIPIDSLYFSCKIDGEPIVIQSPSTTLGIQSNSLARLHKLPNNSADSVIYGRENTYWSDNHIIKIGFSKCLLLDTALIENYSSLKLQSELYKTGEGTIQFYPPPVPIRSVTSYYSGLYITILDRRTNTCYKSFVEESTIYDNLDMYDVFKANSSFKIVSSRQLNSGIYSDYQNAWFLESNFECALFTNDISNPQISNLTKRITEGVIRGCF